MYRALGVVSVIVGLGVLSWAAPMPKQPPSMVQKVNQRANFDGVNDPKATLNDVLDKLSKLYDVSFDINEIAFKLDGIMEVGATEVALPPIPAMKNVQIERVLRKILGRVPAPSGAGYSVRGDRIEITTNTFQKVEIWGTYRGPYLPLVNVVLDKVPLEDAVRQLADQADFNILVDNRAGEKAKTLVSARLINTPLDSALRLLTDMSDLRAVHLDNVMYVTTKENAVALEARLEKEKGPVNEDANPEDLNAPPRWRKGTGRGGIQIQLPPAGA
jgi:hypothetical protein